MQHALRTRRKKYDTSWTYIQSVLTTIGNITIQWAMIELFLAHLIVWHHAKMGLRPAKGIPRMLSYQLDHMKKIEKDGSVDPATAAKLTDIRLRIVALNDFRISVIHGVMHQRNRWATDWHTYGVKIDGLDARVVRNTYSNQEIQTRCKEMSDLAHEMSPLIARIVGIPHPLNSQ